MTSLRAPSFPGDERFQIKRELGRGGMGVVYEAFDRERQEAVALKTLQWIDPHAIYRLKREFRTLADVAHGNLVHLYELIARDDIWFFTMELIEGVDFLNHVRPGALDVPRLRPALRQLVEAVAALHQAGKVHRDIKPSNVLVTKAARVVVLDFGIAVESEPTSALKTVEDGMAGTTEYMSPEQCAGESGTPASDWYAVGVLLYQALTGSLPFSGSLLSVLTRKQQTDPPPPSDLAPDLPADLVELSARLLARAPADRPAEADLLRRVGASAAVVVDHVQPGAEVPFTGRAAELAALEAAFAVAERGEGVSLCVQGSSGIGKTTLVRQFTEQLVQDGRAVVLAGRCYVREAMPYKALDGVVDMLSRLLHTLPDEAIEAALPEDIGALARVFPALRRLEVVDRAAGASREIPDHRELRRRAFKALRDVLAAISRERPTVIHIDDLQWADRDSADLLEDLLGRLAGLRLLVILSFRSEEVANVPLLQSLLARAEARGRRRVEVGPLPKSEALELAQRVLEVAWPDASEYARIVAKESDGNPFLIDQMSRFALSEQGLRSGALGLGEMVDARIRQMPEGAHALVEVLAVAGQPTDAGAAYLAADLGGDERPLVTSLRIAHLVRASSTGERIELYHDRIREHYARQLSASATRRVHLRLAQSLEAKGFDDPEVLYEHYVGAGEPARAAGHAARAAEVAQRALAFERAAEFYERALECSPDSEAVPTSWHMGLGDALASAGRGGEAAKAYLVAAQRPDVKNPLELERRAGEQLLISGRMREGIEVIGRVLQRVGLRLARSSRHALALLLLRRLRLRLWGLRYHERSAAQVPAEKLARVDACWAVAEGFALVDPIQGASFQSLHLLLALDAGEPHRLALALALEGGFAGSSGAERQAERLLEQAEQLARRLDSQHALGLCALLRGTVAYHTGQLRRAAAFTEQAEAILREQVSFVAWHLGTARVYRMSILVELGEVAELCRLSRTYLQDALDRGNIFAATMFLTGWSTLVWLAADDLPGARDALARGLGQFPQGSFQIPHYNCMLARGFIDLYAGDGEGAHRHVTEAWPQFKRSLLMRIRTIRIHGVQLQARCALAAAAAGHDRDALLRFAERTAARIAAQQLPSREANEAKAHLLRAGIRATRGETASALDHLTAAVAVFDRREMALWRAVATRRKGELLGGREGAALLAEADGWMQGQGIRNPERITAVFAPGFRGA